jgi:hypothetical protein
MRKMKRNKMEVLKLAKMKIDDIRAKMDTRAAITENLKSKSSKGRLIHWHAIKARLIMLRLRTRVRNIRFLQCYGGADMCSDHHLVVVKIQLKISVIKKNKMSKHCMTFERKMPSTWN